VSFDIDFPAAHSMDTEWFAVDATGAVAVFDTGEDGALPVTAATGFGPVTGTVDTLTLYRVLLSRRIERGNFEQPAIEIEEIAELTRSPMTMLIALREPLAGYRDVPRSEVDVGALLPESRFLIVREKNPRIGLSREPLSPEAARALVKTGLVVALVTDVMLDEMFHGTEEGDLFRYGRDHGDEPGAYKRVASPAQPLSIDELPEDARAEIGKLRFPVGFADSERLHLADHMRDQDARYWGEWTLRDFGPTEDAGAKQLAPTPPSSRAGMLILVLMMFAGVLWLISRR